VLPDRDKARLVVELLLDLVQQRFPLLTVTFLGLLGIPSVDLWVFDPGLHPGARDEGIDARRGAAEGGTGLQREPLVRAIVMRRLVGGAVEGAHLGPDADRHEVVHNRLPEASEDVIDREVPSLEAAGVAGLGEELPGLLGIVWIGLQRQRAVELARDDVSCWDRVPERLRLVDRSPIDGVVRREA